MFRETKLRAVVFTAALACMAWGATAQGAQPKGEVGLQLGGVVLDSASGLGDAHWRYDVPGNGFALSLRGGYEVMPRLTIEATLRTTPTSRSSTARCPV